MNYLQVFYIKICGKFCRLVQKKLHSWPKAKILMTITWWGRNFFTPISSFCWYRKGQTGADITQRSVFLILASNSIIRNSIYMFQHYETEVLFSNSCYCLLDTWYIVDLFASVFFPLILWSINLIINFCMTFLQDFNGQVFGVKVNAVDTTGAGDGFVAGILNIFASDLDLYKV